MTHQGEEIACEHLIFGWGSTSLESHGVGNGVLGHSPGWPSEIGDRNRNLGSLVRVWGTLQSEPRGLSERTRISALQLIERKGRRLIVRKSLDHSNRSGGTFVHAVVLRDKSFGFRDALLCGAGDIPFRGVQPVANLLPSEHLPMVVLAKGTPAYHVGSFDQETRTLAASLVDKITRASTSRIVVGVEADTEALRIFTGAAVLLPSALTQGLTFSTFEYEIADDSPELVGRVSGLFRTGPNDLACHYLDAATTPPGQDAYIPSDASRRLVDELIDLYGQGHRAPDHLATSNELATWLTAVRAAFLPAHKLSDSKVASLLRNEALAASWMRTSDNALAVTSRACTSDEILSALAAFVAVSDTDLTVELANSTLNFEDDWRLRSVQSALRIDPKRVEDLHVGQVLDAARRGRPLSPTELRRGWPWRAETVDAHDVRALLRYPGAREYAVTGPQDIVRAIIRDELLQSHWSLALPPLIEAQPAAFMLEMSDLIEERDPHQILMSFIESLGVDGVRKVLTKQLVPQSVKSSLVIAMLENPEVASDSRQSILRDHWPEIVHWLPLSREVRDVLTDGLDLKPLNKRIHTRPLFEGPHPDERVAPSSDVKSGPTKASWWKSWRMKL